MNSCSDCGIETDGTAFADIPLEQRGEMLCGTCIGKHAKASAEATSMTFTPVAVPVGGKFRPGIFLSTDDESMLIYDELLDTAEAAIGVARKEFLDHAERAAMFAQAAPQSVGR